MDVLSVSGDDELCPTVADGIRPYQFEPLVRDFIPRNRQIVLENDRESIDEEDIRDDVEEAIQNENHQRLDNLACRVGDSPIMGAGSYASSGVGAAAATGDGDIMMRFLPSFHAVMLLTRGMTVDEAAAESLQPIIKSYPSFNGALIVVSARGDYGAACHGMKSFPYSVRVKEMSDVTVMEVPCI